MGKLIFKFGVMGSGKTADLLIKAINHLDNNIYVELIKPNIDTRDINERESESIGVIKSRIKGLQHNCWLLDDEANFFTNQDFIYDDYKYHTLSILYIDECQFLTDKQVDYLINHVDSFPFDVVAYGLRTDFRGEMFPAIKRIMELCDEVVEIPAKCTCGNNAIINARVDENGNIIKDGPQILIGDDLTYTPVCRKCFTTGHVKLKQTCHEIH